MRLDKFSNPIFNEEDIFDAIYSGYQISPNDIIFVENPEEFKMFSDISGAKLLHPIPESIDLAELDKECQHHWNMPKEYQTLDIVFWLREQVPPWADEAIRLEEEIKAFCDRDMLDLLRWLKYFVDTCTKNNIVWGVGRGSSVASYVLFLIGVHSINPIKYNLDWQEFLR